MFAALVGAITWNLITWYFGLPSSSSHALIGGLIGAALAVGHDVSIGTASSTRSSSRWSCRRDRLHRRVPAHDRDHVGFPPAHPAKVNRGFRLARRCRRPGMALGHGLQDAQKTMGVIVLALVTAGYQDDMRSRCG